MGICLTGSYDIGSVASGVGMRAGRPFAFGVACLCLYFELWLIVYDQKSYETTLADGLNVIHFRSLY